jgi:PAS domain S-box-containing protein
MSSETTTSFDELTSHLPNRYRAMIERSPLPTAVVIGKKHVVGYVNAAYCNLVGQKKEDLIGHPFAETGTEIDNFMAILDRVYRTGKAETSPEQKNSDPHIHHLSYDVWAVPDVDQRPVGIVVQLTASTQLSIHRQQLAAMNQELMLSAVRQHEMIEEKERLNSALQAEITERKRAEEALRESKHELEERVKERTSELYAKSLYARSLIEASLDPLVTISVDGKVTDVNLASEEATGVPREQLIGRDFSEYFTEPLKARAGYERAFRQGFVRDYPLELKHQDGHVTPVLYNASVYRDDTGQIMGVLAAARDITERKRAEETVKAERQRLYDVLETLPVYAILLTPDYHVSFANRFFRERFGEDKGRRCYEYLFKRMEPCEICETYTVQKTGKPHHWEWTGPDGKNYDIFDFPFKDFNGSPLIMEVGIDITKSKRAEAAQRRLASKLAVAEERERRRIAGVLHDDIAQILASARMRLDMLHDIPTDQALSVKEAKAFIAQSLQETRALMNDLGNPVLFELGLEAACLTLARQMMEKHHVRISCDIQDAFEDLNQDVKTVLYQVIKELLNNVVKHSQGHNAQLMIDKENGHLRVKVTDDGVGFDPRMLGAPSVDGGFGLYSIKERLSALDGSLSIESTPGTGTVVTAILPERLD